MEKTLVNFLFGLDGKVVVITGGAGLLGEKHAEAIAEMRGIPILLDIMADRVKQVAQNITEKYDVKAIGIQCDITLEESIKNACTEILSQFGNIDCLINNAANNMKMEEGDPVPPTRLEDFPLQIWQKDFDVAVTGAFLSSRIFGAQMAEQGRGVILNISSDLGIIAPDQRIYADDRLPKKDQVVKPVSYSVTKHALIGLSKYLATYWADSGIRANTLCPGGVFSGQSQALVDELHHRIPLGRMADADEYKGAIQFLCSDASKYMTGACLVMDGGRSVW